MMFLDLDRFKKFNDTLGHHIGDSILIEVARRLRSRHAHLRHRGRLGGDEFVVLLPRISEIADGERVAQRCWTCLPNRFAWAPRASRHPSIGLALYPEHGHDSITLMRRRPGHVPGQERRPQP